MALDAFSIPPSAIAAGTCPNEQLRAEQPYGATLPDCRAYEMVTPLDKGDSDVLSAASRASVSDEAPAITYVSPGIFAEPQSALLDDRYLSRRGPDGWSTEDISPPVTSFGDSLSTPFNELFFTPELSKGVVESEDTPLLKGQPAGYINLYVADLEDDAYQAVTSVTPPYPEVPPYTGGLTAQDGPYTAGVSTDLSHVVFQESAGLVEGAAPQDEHIYEWVGGKLSLVDVTPEGKPFTFNGGEGASVGATGDFGRPWMGDTWHAVSADGLRVFFTVDYERAPQKQVGQLYVRENPEQPQSPIVGGRCSVPEDACTVEVSASQKTNGSGPGGTDPNASDPVKSYVYFRDASADGSRVFFTSKVELTNDADTGKEDNAANLYEYDPETDVLTDLSVVPKAKEAEDPNGAAVLGLVTAGENGSYVYFVAAGDLGGGAVSGQPNLYLYHEGSATFIATLAKSTEDTGTRELGGDSRDWVGPEQHATDIDAGPGNHTVRVTPDGTVLAFESEQELTGYDNERAEPGECENKQIDETGKCRELYLYSAVTGKLICASCDPSGARPVGPTEFGGNNETHDGLTARPSVFYVPGNLSEDGERLFFQSPDALVPRDGNGLLDVYEWERSGVGTCTGMSSDYSATADGCIYPISDVAGGSTSEFMDATPSGDNVFIWTRDQLVPSADADTRANVYDVRVGGGFPVSVSPPACTNADSCRPPVSAQPSIFGAPASATFSGPSNSAPAVAPIPQETTQKTGKKCTKGRRLSHGKCVTNKRKKGSKKANKAKRAANDRRATR